MFELGAICRWCTFVATVLQLATARFASSSVCQIEPESKLKWNESNDAEVTDAVRRAVKFMSNFSSRPDHRVLNTLSFFAEIAETSPDAKAASEARFWATKMAEGFEQQTLDQFRSGSFGELFGLHYDVLEALQLLTYKSSLGLAVPANHGGLLARVSEAFKRCHSCVELGDALDSSDPEVLLNAAVDAYIVDEANFRFGSHLFPVPPNLLRRAFTLGGQSFKSDGGLFLAPLQRHTQKIAYTDSQEQTDDGSAEMRGHHVARAFRRKPRLQLLSQTAKLSPFKKKAYLATHLAFVLGGFDRYRVDPTSTMGEDVFLWLRQAWPHIRGMRDPELTGEVVSAFRSLGCSPANKGTDMPPGVAAIWQADSLVREGTFLLLRLQRPDGGWGDLMKQQKEITELGPELQAYDVLHHVWTAVAALRPRRVLDEHDAYAHRLRQRLHRG